ncbi:hypothetical protein PEDI_45670 [Persicobacter diffluens]|uniref:WG repeat-containing protein n=2 Tax=Persicobacter diffluens TaxID=981 RepID=A0AAN5ALI9_9BACT|nr:hypothetical protein PEDI_45670 [Persicobacter diffluens]
MLITSLTMAQEKDKFVSESEYLKDFQLADDILIPYRVGDLFGYCDKDKNIIISPQWTDAFPFKQGVAAVAKTFDDGQFYALINRKGELLTDYDYKEIMPFDENGLGRVFGRSLQWGALNTKGEEQIPIGFRTLYYKSTGVYIAEYEGKYGIIDENAKTLLPFEFDKLSLCYDGDSYRAVKNGKVGYLDKDFSPITDFIYTSIGLDPGFRSGMAVVNLDGKNLVINNKGETIFDGSEYKDLTVAGDDLIVVSLDISKSVDWMEFYESSAGLFKISTNEMIIDPKKMKYAGIGSLYTKPELFDVFGLKRGSKHGIIDRKGNILLDSEFDRIYITQKNNGVLQLIKKIDRSVDECELYFIENNQKSTFIPGKLFSFSSKNNIPFLVINHNSNNLHGIIDLFGKTVIENKYHKLPVDTQFFIEDGLLQVYKNDKHYYVSFNGNEFVQ